MFPLISLEAARKNDGVFRQQLLGLVIVLMGLSRIVSKIRRDIGRKLRIFHTNLNDYYYSLFNYLCREFHRRSKLDKNYYVKGLCERVDRAHLQQKTKEVFDVVRMINGKKATRVHTVKHKHGVSLTVQQEVKNRWRTHFSELYNVHIVTDQTVLGEHLIPAVSEDTPCLLRMEVVVDVHRLKDKKAPGADNVTAEEIQAAGEAGCSLFDLCKKIWDEEVFPKIRKKFIIVPLHKKHDKLTCDNYRGISLLSHCEKVMAAVIMQRIRNKMEGILSEDEAGFRVKRSTIDQIFTLRRLAQKYYEFGNICTYAM